jgi:hypothetical protein
MHACRKDTVPSMDLKTAIVSIYAKRDSDLITRAAGH